MAADDFVAQVLEGLAELRRIDPKLQRIFGAADHGYRVAPPLSEDEALAFEAARRLTLPPGYRAFLTGVGNGGAGPHYGILALGNNIDAKPMAEEEYGFPHRPFPHRKAWNWSAKRIEREQTRDEEAFIAQYYMKDGTLPLSHRGCALADYLVVSGAEDGNVWLNATADSQGWSPVVDPAGNHLSFDRWYLQWLDDALSGRFPCPGQKPPVPFPEPRSGGILKRFARFLFR